jgi:hypothetical protein
MMTKISLQTELNILNRQDTEVQEEKAELTLQTEQLQEDESNLIDLLHDEDDTIVNITALHTSIKQEDDSYNQMMLTRISHQTEIDLLNKNTTESKNNKTELVQQNQQLHEDPENTIMAQGDPVPDETTSNSRHPSEYFTHTSQTNKEATISTHDDAESFDNANETVLQTLSSSLGATPSEPSCANLIDTAPHQFGPCTCDQCDSTFTRNSTLRNHKHITHNDPPNLSIPLDTTDTEEEPETQPTQSRVKTATQVLLPTITTEEKSMDSSNDTLAHDDDQSQAPKVMEPTEPTIVDNNTGEEPGVLVNIIQGNMTVGNVYWSKLKYHLPTQSRTKALLSSVKATTAKYLTWSPAGTGLIMLQPRPLPARSSVTSPTQILGTQMGPGSTLSPVVISMQGSKILK